jgi:hypothetical protein
VTGWKNKAVDEGELRQDIDAVIKMFRDAGGTDGVAKSPQFQDQVVKAAEALRTAMAAKSSN